MKERVNRLAVLTKGIIKENPNLVLLLGTCPTLATTSSAFNGMGMGIAATGSTDLLQHCNFTARKVIPDKVRIPCYIVLIAGFVTLVQFIVQAFAEPALQFTRRVPPLIVVNCIILGRAEMFANKNGVLDSALDGIGMGLGFTLSLTCIGAVREIIGNGTIFSGFFLGGEDLVAKLTIAIPFISEHPMLIIALAPGGFFVYACAIAVVNKILLPRARSREISDARAARLQACATRKNAWKN